MLGTKTHHDVAGNKESDCPSVFLFAQLLRTAAAECGKLAEFFCSEIVHIFRL